MNTKTKTVALILIALFFTQGCDNSKIEKLEADLIATRKQIGEAQDTLVNAKQKLETALDDIEKVTAENQELLVTKLNYERVLSDENELRRILLRLKKVKEQVLRFNTEARQYEQPGILFEKMLNDTVYIKIEDSELLTQRMGSAGASAYMQAAIASFTSVNGINCIDFDFEMGDHAVPGKYCK